MSPTVLSYKDTKLTFIIHNLIKSYNSKSLIEKNNQEETNISSWTWLPNHVLELLLDHHREYRRKNRTVLRSAIKKIIDDYNIKIQENNSKEDNPIMTPFVKRLRDDSNYIEPLDQRRMSEGKSVMNIGLRKSYRERNLLDSKIEKKKLILCSSMIAPRTVDPYMEPHMITTRPFVSTPRPTERYTDLAGMSHILTQIRHHVECPLLHPELLHHLGLTPPHGVLLRGPPGCGKSLLADAIGGQLGHVVSYYRIPSTELVGGMTGESEQRIRDLFDKAKITAPSLIFLDEIDSIAPKREDGKSMEKRVVAQLVTCLDSLSRNNIRATNTNKNAHQPVVIVLGATNRPDAMDPSLRRAGRFDREILMGAPDEKSRVTILQQLTKLMKLQGNMNWTLLARRTAGYVGADLKSLTREAGVCAIDRNLSILDAYNLSVHSKNTSQDDSPHFEPCNLQSLQLTMEDFLKAIKHVQPTAQREGFSTLPNVTWKDIGALQNIREELFLTVIQPIIDPEPFQQLGLPLPSGILLYGPPGCGKTLLAKAIAQESGANFISIKGPELLDKYVGESERAVRRVFDRARGSSPCLIFFDELDSLCPRRGQSGEGPSSNGVGERVVNQLLTEMDGMDGRRSLFVIAATNRPELIDPAMLRPGRLDKLLYVPLPTPKDRTLILNALASKVSLGTDVNIEKIATSSRAEGYSGADCAALLREAGLAVIREHALKRYEIYDSKGIKDREEISPPLQICTRHFHSAFNHVLPSVSKQDQVRYDQMRERMARARSRVGYMDSKQNVNGDMICCEKHES